MAHAETALRSTDGRSCAAEWAGVETRLRRLSRGNVEWIKPTGPVFVSPRPVRRLRPDTFVPALTRADRAVVVGLAVSWGISFVWFWSWWLEPQHRVAWPGFLLNSALLCYVTMLPAYFLAMICRLHKVNPALAVPAVPVAFVVTRAPSESWVTVRRTIEAMLAQDYPHPYDVWLCDEAPTRQIRAWCAGHGVRLSCRRNAAGYHRSVWPRRTRCKEGNLAYFYDHWGYRFYAVVAQLDCDHVPAPRYLAEMVRPFADPAVGYVAAPSICDANAAGSWAARGRLYREAVWHGAVQLGHSGGMAPLCIGSHYAVRTTALRAIGGIGPELAEDFSTTFLLNAAGWQGAFAIDAEAHGDGPLTYSDMITQEFQWSRSLTTMLLDLIWDHVDRMPFLLRVRFVCALGYYPTHGLVITLGLTLPPAAVIAGIPWMDINYVAFVLHVWFMLLWLVLALAFMRWRGLLRPRTAPVLSWETWLFTLASWPFVVWGVLAAVIQKFRPRPVDFKVTRKQREGLEPLPARLVAPFVLLSVPLAAAAVYGELTSPSVGYVFLCTAAATAYATVALAVPLLHVREAARAAGVPLRAALLPTAPATLLGAVFLAPAAVAVLFFPAYAFAVLG